MARLGRLAEGTPVALELLQPGSSWRLTAPLDLTSHGSGPGLATQAAGGRCFTVVDGLQPGASRLRVRLLEDGYPGWVNPRQLLGHARACQPPQPPSRTATASWPRYFSIHHRRAAKAKRESS